MNTEKWVNGWGLGVTHPPLSEAQWCRDTTVRYIIINTLDASAVRLKFTNRFTNAETVLSHVTVAKSVDGKCKIDESTVTDVTFGGSVSGKMAPFGDIVSDEIPFFASSGDKIAVSIYFKDFTKLDTGFTYDNKYMVRRFIEGDATESGDFDLYKMSYSAAYNFLWSIDFLCDESAYSVAAFGDSLTSQEWVDILNLKLIENGIKNRAVVRRAVSGSRIFGSYPALSYFHYGEDGMTRFEREVMHDGVKKVIIFHGINDIIHPDGKNPMRPMSNMPTAEQMMTAYKRYVDTAHRLGLEAYLATLLPIKGWRTYDLPRDDIRIAVNGEIRRQGFADGVIDFEKAVRNENDTRAFAPECNRGDCLHASLTGYERMANAVDMKIFE